MKDPRIENGERVERRPYTMLGRWSLTYSVVFASWVVVCPSVDFFLLRLLVSRPDLRVLVWCGRLMRMTSETKTSTFARNSPSKCKAAWLNQLDSIGVGSIDRSVLCLSSMFDPYPIVSFCTPTLWWLGIVALEKKRYEVHSLVMPLPRQPTWELTPSAHRPFFFVLSS
jgi:hypothetical protein